MYHPAYPVQVVQSYQHLLCQSSTQMQGDSFEIIPLYNVVEIGPKHFKYEAKMVSIGAAMDEAVEKAYHVSTLPCEVCFLWIIPFQALLPLFVILRSYNLL